MAITPIWECGFEYGDADQEMTFTGNAGQTYVTSTASNVKTDTFALTYAISAMNLYQAIPSTAQMQVGCHLLTAASGAAKRIFTLSNDSGDDTIIVSWDQDATQWVISDDSGTITTVTDTGMAATGNYYHISVDVKIHATTGWVYLWRDGQLIVDFDGDTANGGANITRFRLSTGTVAGGWGGALDDVVLYDSTGEASPAPVPDQRLWLIDPNGNGNYNEWDGSDGNAVNNFQLVDERPPSSSDYITTATVDDTESFAMSTFTMPDGFDIQEVILHAFAMKVDGLGSMGLKLGSRLSGVDAIGSVQALGTAVQIYRQRQTTKPGGGAWTISDIDNMELIVEAGT